MNNRFEQLKEQCWVERDWDQENSRWVDRHIDLTKFAELIVSECVMLCDKVYEQNDNVKIQAGATFCREDIKKHFGVE